MKTHFPLETFPKTLQNPTFVCNSWDKLNIWNSCAGKLLPAALEMQYHSVALHDSKPNLCFPLTALLSNAYLGQWISLLREMLGLPASASEFPGWLITILLFLKFLQNFYMITDLLTSKRGPSSIYIVNIPCLHAKILLIHL